jgi:hypothetical protein
MGTSLGARKVARKGEDARARPAYASVNLRRGSFLLLVASCATGLLLSVSYLGGSSAQASAGESGSFEGQVERMIEARQTMSDALVDRAHEIAYGLERAKDELEGLIP